MQLYRIVIRPVMSFSSNLQSDTLFGAFCWSYRYYFGEKALTAFLGKMLHDEPMVIFSNAFPHETLPLPLGIRDTDADFEKISDKEERKRAYQNNKKLKSAKFVRREWFAEIAQGNYSGFTKGLTDDGLHSQTLVHNMVSREDGVVQNIDGSGNLYEEDETFMEKGLSYDIYLLSSLDEKKLKQIVQMMFLLGIGKNKSTGKGSFEILDWEIDNTLLKSENPNGFMALSNFVPAENDPVKGWYKTLVKYGKLDREYAATEIPFKKPLLFLQAGAVFQSQSQKIYYGCCLDNISIRPEVVTNAYTIAVPIHLDL